MRVAEPADLAEARARLVAAVQEAGGDALSRFRQPLKSWTKGKQSPVSEADIAANVILRDHLMTVNPDFGWLSEESEDDGARQGARYVWVVDPIDGTRAYIDGRPDWAVSAALVDHGRPVVAVLFAPVSGELFVAVKSEGATLNGDPIAASGGASLEGARVAGRQRQLESLAALVPIVTVPNIHSLALRLARVAQGVIDVALARSHSHDWDLAAADLLVHEAGGALTSLTGAALTYNRPDPVHDTLVAAGRERHAALVDLLRERHSQLA
ncbi:MAG: inositol monophosphatase family protein [Xanthobacteraceae bacterium]